MSTMITFSLFSLIFMSIGVLLFIMSDRIVEIVQRYDDTCHSYLRSVDFNGAQMYCTVSLTIDEDIDGPIYVYYQLDNFY